MNCKYPKFHLPAVNTLWSGPGILSSPSNILYYNCMKDVLFEGPDVRQDCEPYLFPFEDKVRSFIQLYTSDLSGDMCTLYMCVRV